MYSGAVYVPSLEAISPFPWAVYASPKVFLKVCVHLLKPYSLPSSF